MNSSYDLNALRTLFLLYRERSVTAAARVAGVTQPSMSRTLARLRETWNDRLFVRQKDELVATAFTEQLISRLRPLFEEIDHVVDDVMPLQPETATGGFQFTAPEFISKFAMSNLPSSILTITPQVAFRYCYWPTDIELQLQSGEIDLAFGYIPECPNHVRCQVIGEDHYGVIHRTGHPLAGSVDLDNWLSFPHISVENGGLGDAFVDRALAAQGKRRQVVVNTPDIAAALMLLEKTDYLLVAPVELVRLLNPQVDISDYPLDPVNMTYGLYWGAIKEQNPLHLYIRTVIQQTFELYWNKDIEFIT